MIPKIGVLLHDAIASATISIFEFHYYFLHTINRCSNENTGNEPHFYEFWIGHSLFYAIPSK
jgi:hypothetical protein